MKKTQVILEAAASIVSNTLSLRLSAVRARIYSIEILDTLAPTASLSIWLIDALGVNPVVATSLQDSNKGTHVLDEDECLTLLPCSPTARPVFISSPRLVSPRPFI